MKKTWLGFSAGVVAGGLTLWFLECFENHQDGRISQSFVAAGPVSVPLQTPGASESAESVLRTQFRALWRGEPWTRGEADERLSEWRTLLACSDAAGLVRTLSPEELASPFGSAAFEAWLAQDDAAASKWIAEQPGATDHHAWLVAEALGRKPQVFAAFCQGLGQSSWVQAFLDYSSRAWIRESPAAAAALAETLISDERRVRLFEAIAADWVLCDPEAARVWISGVSDPSLQHRLVTIGAQSYASTNPLRALEWLLAQSPPDAALQEPLQTIAGIWRHTASPEINDSLDNLTERSGRPTEGPTARIDFGTSNP